MSPDAVFMTYKASAPRLEAEMAAAISTVARGVHRQLDDNDGAARLMSSTAGAPGVSGSIVPSPALPHRLLTEFKSLCAEVGSHHRARRGCRLLPKSRDKA